MAEIAAKLIQDGDHIFLDASTTAVFVAKALKEKKERVIHFIDEPLIMQSLCYAIPHIKDQKTKIKMILARYKMIGMLNFLYLGRNGVLSKIKNR